MPYINGIVTKPVATQDVAKALGRSSSKVGVLCTMDNINKWAKYKPIKYDKVTALTEMERVGTVADRQNGIYYGVKLAVASRISNMHEVNFEYNKPGKGDWARLGDFDGYDHKAVPNPVGVLPDVIYIDLPYKDGDVQLKYNPNNTTGINLNDIITNTISSTQTLGDYYPCVLVTVGNRKWCRALWNGQYALSDLSNATNKNRGFTTFKQNGAWVQGWKLLLDIDSENGTKEQPNFAENSVLTVSVFFIRSIGSVAGTGFDGTADLRKWTDVSNLLVTNTGYACPDAVARTITLKRWGSKGLRLSAASWIIKSAGVITVALVPEWLEPRVDETYRLTGLIIDSSGINIGVITYDFIYTGGGLFIYQKDVTVTDRGLTSSAKLRMDWTVSVGTEVRNTGSTEMQYMI